MSTTPVPKIHRGQDDTMSYVIKPEFNIGEHLYVRFGNSVAPCHIDSMTSHIRQYVTNPPSGPSITILYKIYTDGKNATMHQVDGESLFRSPAEAFGLQTTEAYKITVEKL